MIASHPRTSFAFGSLRAALCAACCATLAALALACATRHAALPAGSPLEPLPTLSARPPDEIDRSAHALPTAALAPAPAHALGTAVLLAEPAQANAARKRIDALDADRARSDEPPSGLSPYAQDAVNATAPDTLAFQAAQRELLERKDLEESLRRRVEADVDDDPLSIADQRMSDARRSHVSELVNTFSQAIGTSITTPTMVPYRLAMGLLGYGLAKHREEELTPPERQALGQWKAYVERHPDSPEAANVLDEIEKTQQRWLQTQRDRSIHRAKLALKRDQPDVARVHAERALRYAPEDRGAARLRDEASRALALRWRNLERSVAAKPDADPRAERALALALLTSGGDVAAQADALLASAPEGPLADEARLSLALAAADAGREKKSWNALEKIAAQDPADSNTSRYASFWIASPEQNPAGAFRRTNRLVTRRHLQSLALGPLANGPPAQDLPRPVEWLLVIPYTPVALIGLPSRLVRFPFDPPDRSGPAALARRYLERSPAGDEAASMREWLLDYEKGRGNYVGALRVAQSEPAPDPELVADLEERAGKQALERATNERRYDVRIPLLEEVARQFPSTEAAKQAGLAVRKEAEQASPQRIRISKEFLLENPAVAGPAGLALRPELLDGRLENGELHPDGVTLLGGDVVEFAFIGMNGRASGEPELRREQLSPERVTRLVAQLEESSEQLGRTDPDMRIEPDAGRDLYFERARLGVEDAADPRPQSRSSYAYIGSRERYGVVRSREPILPVEIVLQGSFQDFGLGAFPRLRLPKPTPDEMLYH